MLIDVLELIFPRKYQQDICNC